MNAASLQSGVQQSHIHRRMAAGQGAANPEIFRYWSKTD
jgi:hypothetical protein